MTSYVVTLLKQAALPTLAPKPLKPRPSFLPRHPGSTLTPERFKQLQAQSARLYGAKPLNPNSMAPYHPKSIRTPAEMAKLRAQSVATYGGAKPQRPQLPQRPQPAARPQVAQRPQAAARPRQSVVSQLKGMAQPADKRRWGSALSPYSDRASRQGVISELNRLPDNSDDGALRAYGSLTMTPPGKIVRPKPVGRTWKQLLASKTPQQRQELAAKQEWLAHKDLRQGLSMREYVRRKMEQQMQPTLAQTQPQPQPTPTPAADQLAGTKSVLKLPDPTIPSREDLAAAQYAKPKTMPSREDIANNYTAANIDPRQQPQAPVQPQPPQAPVQPQPQQPQAPAGQPQQPQAPAGQPQPQQPQAPAGQPQQPQQPDSTVPSREAIAPDMATAELYANAKKEWDTQVASITDPAKRAQAAKAWAAKHKPLVQKQFKQQIDDYIAKQKAKYPNLNAEELTKQLEAKAMADQQLDVDDLNHVADWAAEMSQSNPEIFGKPVSPQEVKQNPSFASQAMDMFDSMQPWQKVAVLVGGGVGLVGLLSLMLGGNKTLGSLMTVLGPLGAIVAGLFGKDIGSLFGGGEQAGSQAPPEAPMPATTNVPPAAKPTAEQEIEMANANRAQRMTSTADAFPDRIDNTFGNRASSLVSGLRENMTPELANQLNAATPDELRKILYYKYGLANVSDDMIRQIQQLPVEYWKNNPQAWEQSGQLADQAAAAAEQRHNLLAQQNAGQSPQQNSAQPAPVAMTPEAIARELPADKKPSWVTVGLFNRMSKEQQLQNLMKRLPELKPFLDKYANAPEPLLRAAIKRAYGMEVAPGVIPALRQAAANV